MDAEQSLYIVDFTNVYCAYSFVCLLVELHINACITYQVIKIAFSITSRRWRDIRFYLPLSDDGLELENKRKVELHIQHMQIQTHTQKKKTTTKRKQVEYFFHTWVHLLFDPVQW